MSDSDKASWQAVQEEPADKLHRRDGNRFCPLLLSVFCTEGDHAVFKGFDAAIGNGHPMGITRQVFNNKFRALDRVAHTDHPVFCIQHVFEVAIGSACKFDGTGFADMLQFPHELAIAQARESLESSFVLCFASQTEFQAL
jgi:hypothetical protein